MPLEHPDDLEIIYGIYYQNLHSYDEDMYFSDNLCCPICGKCEIFILPTNDSDQSDTLVTEKNKVSKQTYYGNSDMVTLLIALKL